MNSLYNDNDFDVNNPLILKFGFDVLFIFVYFEEVIIEEI